MKAPPSGINAIGKNVSKCPERHCEEHSDEAIQLSFPRLQWIASLRAQ
jgi:hypothetical protein